MSKRNFYFEMEGVIPKGVFSPDLEIVWIMLLVHEARKPSLATKVDNNVIGSHTSFASHFRNVF